MMPAGDGLLQWWFEVRQNTGFSAAGQLLTHELLRKAFGDWADPVLELLGLVRNVAAEEWHYVRHVVPRTLGRGGVVLIGDAVHAMPLQLIGIDGLVDLGCVRLVAEPPAGEH